MSVLPFGSALPPIDPAKEPAAIRNGNQTAKKAYETGLAFEQVLVNELSQELAQTASAPDGSSDGLGGGSDGTSDGSSGGSGSTGGLMSGDPAASTYAQLLPQALTSAVMGAGGTGLAMQLATSLDPALRRSTK